MIPEHKTAHQRTTQTELATIEMLTQHSQSVCRDNSRALPTGRDFQNE